MSNLTKPNIPFQYQKAEAINELIDGFFIQAQEVSIENLDNFLNIDDASGLWLDQIGLYLNYQRPNIKYGDYFITDTTGIITDSIYYLDSESSPASDDLYRVLLKSEILRRNSKFTNSEVVNIIKQSTGAVKVFISEYTKNVKIYAVYNDQDKADVVNLINSIDDKFFGLPTGCGLTSFNVIILPSGEDIFISDFSKTDTTEEVVI